MGGEGRQAQNVAGQATAGSGYLGGRAAASNDPRIANLLAQYGSGGMSFKDAMSQSQGFAGSAAKAAREKAANAQVDQQIQQALQGVPESLRPQMQQQMQAKRGDMYNQALSQIPDDAGGAESSIADLMTTNPLAAQKYISDTVRNDPMSKRLFGEGGEMDKSIADTAKFNQQGDEAGDYAKQIQSDERDLAGRGYSLKPEDYEAYGQMSDELARSFGAQEKGASRALASRGLASAPSGQAGALFSGIQGNKFEQLAKAQQNVAQARMDTNMKRLNDTRQFLGQQQQNANSKYGLGQNARQQTMGLGNQQDQYANSLFNRSMGGRQQNYNESLGVAGMQQKDRQAAQDQLNTGFEQNEATRPPSAGEIAGGVLGGAAGVFTGGLAGGAAKGISNSLFPKKTV